MKNQELINRNQFIAVGFCALLAPATRTLPALLVPIAGEHAWLCAIVSIPVLCLMVLFMQRFRRSLAPGEGIAVLFTRILGRWLGSALLIVFALWLLFYSAFTLRSAANRFISTIFPESSPWAYIPTMGILAFVTAVGHFKVLARVSEIMKPFLSTVTILVLISALPGVTLNTFSAPVPKDAIPIIIGIIPIVNAVSCFYYLMFLEGHVAPGPAKMRQYIPAMLTTVLMITLICFTTIGIFGPVLINNLTNPFFLMIRNIRIFNTLERIEALVIALWFFTDFILVSALMHAATAALCHAFGISIKRDGRMLTLRDGHWLVWLCSLAIIVCALTFAPTTVELEKFSMQIIPILNITFTIGVMTLIFIIGLFRKKV